MSSATARMTWLESLCESATPNFDECLVHLGGVIPLLYELEHTEQDPEWHAEGNVRIHTSMVLTETYSLLNDEARHFTGLKRQTLILAALLHDIAKPLRTRSYEVDGVKRIGAPRHASVGRSYLAFKLPELGLPFEVTWTVLNLVGEHHTPKQLVVNDKPRYEFFKLARQSDNELLYWLEVADIRGRICSDPNAQLQYLEEFRMFAEEYGVWGKSLEPLPELSGSIEQLSPSPREYVYAYGLHQMESGKIHLAEEAIGTSYEHRDNHAELIVLCGPSGSGKSSWHRKNLQEHRLISLDDLRLQFNGDAESQKNKGQIQQEAKRQLREALRDKGKVIWDATNLRTDFRSVVCGLGMDYHGLVTLVVFLCPEAVLNANNRARDRQVPADVMQKQVQNYQFPLLPEAHRFMVVDHEGVVQFRSGYVN